MHLLMPLHSTLQAAMLLLPYLGRFPAAISQHLHHRFDLDFSSTSDTGHGPFGHMVAKKVWDSLPLLLCTQWKANSDGGLSNLSKTENAHGNSKFEEPASPSIDDEGRESMEVQESENIPDVCTTKKVILKGFQVNG